MNKFDVVIPVSYKDCWFLRKVIPYIRKNIVTDGVIFVLTSSRCFREFSQDFLSRNNVSVLDENQLYPTLTYTNVKNALAQYNMSSMTGWYFQQFLKLAFACSNYAKEYYLIWDADTIPLNKLSFFEGEKILVNPKREYHVEYFETIYRLLGLHKSLDYSYISEHMMIRTDIVRQMLNDISPNADWWEQIIRKCDFSSKQAFSEFETIGTYCSAHYPQLFQLRQLSTLRWGGSIWGRQVTDTELERLGRDFDTVSFERGAKPFFPRSIWWKLHSIFIEIKYRLIK